MASPVSEFSYPQASAGDYFICAECGEGFGQYPKLINHMAIHGPTDPISSNNESTRNDCDAPLEFALHENGTLTVVDRSALSNFSFLFGKSTSKPFWSQTFHQDSLPPNNMSEREHTLCRCERCGQVFRTQRSLQQHQRYRPLEQGFKCTLCCKTFYDRESLRGHLQNHAHERFYSCGHCGKRFLKQETMLLHQKEWHGSFGSKSSSKLEEDCENSMDRSYPCKICGLRFFWLSDLQSHLINHYHVNKPNEDNTQKEDMQKQDENRQKKNVSYSSESVDQSYRCGLCGGRFDCLSDLKKHHLSEHPDDECDEDSYKATRQVKLQPVNYYGIMRQMQRMDTLSPRVRGRPRGCANANNHNSKIFPCKQCHRVFVHSSSLSRHMRYHKGTLHTCLYCGKHFPQRCDVTRHVAMYHILDMRIKAECEPLEFENENGDESSKKQASNNEDDDGKPKPQGGQLLDTQKISFHKPWKTYKCKECGRVFGLLSVYQRHVRYHRRDPSRVLLRCPHCPCRFTFQSALDRHLENHDKEGSEKNGKGVSPRTKDNKEYLDKEDKNLGVDKSPPEPESTSTEVLYECTECTQTFSDLQIFLQHQTAHG